MKYVIKGTNVFINGSFRAADVFICDGRIVFVSQGISVFDSMMSDNAFVSDDTFVFDFTANKYFVFPGLVDVHVHLREPGFSYKATIASETLAAAKGGYTDVCSMPNLNPAPDSFETLKQQLDIIKKDAFVNVHPYGTITKRREGKELAEIDELADLVVAFTDDGSGIQNDELMRKAMKKVKTFDKIIAAHCEDISYIKEGGYIHDGEYAKMHNHIGISSESEWKQVERDVKLARETGAKYHVCHVSTKESVEIIRQAKRDGVNVTCETAPHYLVFSDMDITNDGRFKMNPPIRSEADRMALIEGIKDGTIDMIATDHAPHSFEEKSKGLKGSLMGVVGLETAFPVLYTRLVKTGVISLNKLVELMTTFPAERFNIESGIEVGKAANITVFDISKKFIINSKVFLSKGKSSPFEGLEVYGKTKMTMVNGRIVWND